MIKKSQVSKAIPCVPFSCRSMEWNQFGDQIPLSTQICCLSCLLEVCMYVYNTMYSVHCTMYIHVWHVMHAMYAHIAPKRYSMGCSTDLSKENTDFSWTLFTVDPAIECSIEEDG